jgi:hypothetical protein
MDMQIPTSKSRMRAFRGRRALAETTEQKESRLATDRQYRKQRLRDFSVRKTNEDKHTHLISRSQYETCLFSCNTSFDFSQRCMF